MNLKRNIGFLFLMGMMTSNVYADFAITSSKGSVQTVDQSVDEVRLKELQDFRKKYKLADPKASAAELKKIGRAHV